MRAFVPLMLVALVSATVVGAIDLDELYKRAAQENVPPPPPPPVDPAMAEWSTDALMGMNSDSGMGSVFEEMQKRHSHSPSHHKKAARHAPVPHREVAEEAPAQPQRAVKPARTAAKAAKNNKARKVKLALERKGKANAKAKATREAARAKQAKKAVQSVEAEAQKADHSAARATMLSAHVFTEKAQPVSHSHAHMLTSNVFGGHRARAAPKKKRVQKKLAPKKKAVKPLRAPKVHLPRAKPARVHLPHAPRHHESSMDILSADPEKRQDRSGMSLTGLAGNMLTADDEEDKAKKAQAAAKAKKQHQRKQKRKKEMQQNGIHSSIQLNLDVDDDKEDHSKDLDEKKLPPLDAFMPGMDDADDDF